MCIQSLLSVVNMYSAGSTCCHRIGKTIDRITHEGDLVERENKTDQRNMMLKDVKLMTMRTCIICIMHSLMPKKGNIFILIFFHITNAAAYFERFFICNRQKE